jgi:Fe-S-cluster containining protein
MTKNKTVMNCEGCTLCCEYATIELSEPKTKMDLEEIKWFLLHNIMILIDGDGSWNVVINNKCIALNKEGLCDIYDLRPDICRKYAHEECERYEDSEFIKEKKIIKTLDEFEAYLNSEPKLKKIDSEKQTV